MESSLFDIAGVYDEGLLDVGEGHRIWFCQRGNPDGLPLVLLHGGPGSGSSPAQARFFDPAHYRVVQFDQRGAGRSLPAGELAANDTPRLIADIECLRRHLGIERWLVSGGSWGATLAILYAAAHRSACLGVLARATWRAEPEDLAWFLAGAGESRPQAWQRFTGHVRARTAEGLLHGYARALLRGEEDQAMAAAQAWSEWEHALSSGPDEAPLPAADAIARLRRCRLLLNYLVRGCDLPGNALLHAAGRLGRLPVAFAHGTEDLVCRLQSAVQLHQAAPGSVLALAHGAGHDPFHPAMAGTMLALARSFAEHGRF